MLEIHKQFLDRIQESGKINMYGAGVPLRETFGLTRMQAHRIVMEWIQLKDQDNK